MGPCARVDYNLTLCPLQSETPTTPTHVPWACQSRLYPLSHGLGIWPRPAATHLKMKLCLEAARKLNVSQQLLRTLSVQYHRQSDTISFHLHGMEVSSLLYQPQRLKSVHAPRSRRYKVLADNKTIIILRIQGFFSF
jgi:hypothetical protein